MSDDKAQKWIMITDKLPEVRHIMYLGEPCVESDPVLVCAKEKDGQCPYNQMAVGYWAGDRWEIMDDSFPIADDCIVAWMPLPEAPNNSNELQGMSQFPNYKEVVNGSEDTYRG